MGWIRCRFCSSQACHASLWEHTNIPPAPLEHTNTPPPAPWPRRLFDLESRQWRQLPVRGMSPLPRFLFGFTQYSPASGGADRFVLFGGQTGAQRGVRRSAGWEAAGALIGMGVVQGGVHPPSRASSIACRGGLQAERRVAAQPGQQPVAAAVAALLHKPTLRAPVWLSVRWRCASTRACRRRSTPARYC